MMFVFGGGLMGVGSNDTLPSSIRSCRSICWWCTLVTGGIHNVSLDCSDRAGGKVEVSGQLAAVTTFWWGTLLCICRNMAMKWIFSSSSLPPAHLGIWASTTTMEEWCSWLLDSFGLVMRHNLTVVLTRPRNFNSLHKICFWSGDGCFLWHGSSGTGKGEQCILYQTYLNGQLYHCGFVDNLNQVALQVVRSINW